MSRYGIDVSKDDVRRIFAGLAGGEVEEDACLDVFEMVAILVIPLLVKVRDRATVSLAGCVSFGPGRVDPLLPFAVPDQQHHDGAAAGLVRAGRG